MSDTEKEMRDRAANARSSKKSYGSKVDGPRITGSMIEKKRKEQEERIAARPDVWVRARLLRGDKSWILFSEKEWDAMETHDRQKYEFQRSNDPGNKYTLRGRLSGKRRGTRVHSSLGPTKLY